MRKETCALEEKRAAERESVLGGDMEKILILVDMQNDFVDGALGTSEAQAIVGNVVSKIRNFQGRIIATLDTHGQNYLETAEGKKLPVPHCIKGTEGWKIKAEVLAALESKNYQLVEKNTFGSVGLPELVREMTDGREEELEIELAGLCTDICVVSNALLLKAHFPQAGIKVDADCCAGVTPKTHQAALETMGMCQIDIIGG